MPINKRGIRYYTREQQRRAKMVGVLAYVQAAGYEVIQRGRYFRLKEHDSVVIAPNGRWYWNSHGVSGGNAVSFMLLYEGMNAVDAILKLTEEMAPAEAAPKAMPTKPKIDFIPPPKAPHANRLFAYLCKVRGISRQTVTKLIRDGLLYEGIICKNGREYHNAIFPYYDANGVMVGAYQRGLHPESPYKCDVAGSCKDYGWVIRGTGGGKTLYVFEAMLDAASQMDYSRLLGCEDEEGDRLALGGLAARPLIEYVNRHPNLERVVLMLDNDAAGNVAAGRLQAEALYQRPGLTVIRELPPTGKDWNDTLRKLREKTKNEMEEQS